MGDPLIEDLAPRPGPPQRGPRWELLLGLLLALVVVLFAGADWWQQQAVSAQYTAAKAASARRDWAAARDLFLRLGDYLDAPEQYNFAVAQISERDRLYFDGMVAVYRSDWVGAALALSATVAIQPHYSEADAIFEVARTQIVKNSLAGVVLRRVSGTPGLYLLPASGLDELLLPSSDALSSVLATDSYGHILYDSAAPAGAPTIAASDTVHTERKLQLVTFAAGSLRALPLGVATGVDRPILGKDGMWLPIAPRTVDISPTVRGYVNFMLAYSDFATGVATTVALPGPNWAVLAIDSTAGKLLLGEFNGLQPAGVPSTRLYLAEPDGADPHPITLAAGTVLNASFSPDGANVVYMAQQERGRGLDLNRASLTLVDLSKPEPQEQTVATAVVAYGSQAVPLAAVFLPGAGPQRLLIKLSNGVSSAFSVRDVASGNTMRLWENTPISPETYWLQPDGNSVLYRQPTADGTQFTKVSLNIERPLAPAILPILPASNQLLVSGVRLGNSYALYETRRRADGALALYAGATVAATPATLLFTSGAIPSAESSTLPLSGGFLAYIAGDALRLRSLDATLDLAALEGVDALWPFGLPQPQVWLPGE